MTCQRVLIIHRGRIVASDTTEQLRNMMMGGARIVVEIRGPRDEVLQQLQSLSGAQRVAVSGEGEWGCYTLECAKEADLRADIFGLAAARGWALSELRLEKKSLEDIFVSLTRDDPEGAAP